MRGHFGFNEGSCGITPVNRSKEAPLVPNLSQLSKRRQYRFLSQLVEYLENYSKRVREFFRFSFNSPTPIDGPRLYILGEMLLWEFSYQNPDQMETQARLVATTDALFSEAADQQSDSNTLLKQRLITQFNFECTCQGRNSFSTVLCPHTAASIEFLRKRLERATTDEALEWLNSCIASPESLGQTLVDSLEQDRLAIANTNDFGDDCRIVWRVSQGTPMPSIWRWWCNVLRDGRLDRGQTCSRSV